MTLVVTDVDQNRVVLTNEIESGAHQSRAKAAADRMFSGVALITKEHLEDLIEKAKHAPGGMSHDLERLHDEFFG